MTTIKDVAKKAEVSVATVSRVLNGTGYTSDKVIQKVLKAKDELNYTPNSVARSLSKKRSEAIGLFIPNTINPYFLEFINTIEAIAYENKYSLVLCNYNYDLEKTKKYICKLSSHNLAGFIVAGDKDNGAFKNINTPIVSIDNAIDGRISFLVDNFKGGYMATEFIYKKGCRDILYIKGPFINSINERYSGFCKFASENEFKYNVIESDLEFDNTINIFKEYLKNNNVPDGIICANDIIALAVVKHLIKIDVKIPTQCKVIGYDNIKECEMNTIGITSVKQPTYEMAKHATKCLISLIEGKKDVKGKVFDVEIIERETT